MYFFCTSVLHVSFCFWTLEVVVSVCVAVWPCCWRDTRAAPVLSVCLVCVCVCVCSVINEAGNDTLTMSALVLHHASHPRPPATPAAPTARWHLNAAAVISLFLKSCSNWSNNYNSHQAFTAFTRCLSTWSIQRYRNYAYLLYFQEDWCNLTWWKRSSFPCRADRTT